MKRPFLAGAAALLATSAEAHGTLAGGGGFYAGILHPFLAWEHLPLLAGLGLALGGRSREFARMPLVCLALALAAGLAAGARGVVWQMASAGVLAGAVLVGSALILALRVPVAVMIAVSVVAGALVGIDTGVPPATGSEIIAAYAPYAGVFMGVFLIVLNTLAVGTVAQRPPLGIAVRVAGSWIVASAVIVLALQLKDLSGPA